MAQPSDLTDLAFQPDPYATEPIYVQLAEALSGAIRAGRFAVGARLPSERTYAAQLGVSRTTVTSAYEELKAMGLMRGYVGRGAIVVANDPDDTPAGAVPWQQLASPLARPSVPARGGADSRVISFADGWLHPSLIPAAALEACAARAARERDLLTSAAP